MASEIKKFYEFGGFRFDAGRLRLEHRGEAVAVPPKSLETLKILLEEKGEIVTRENLLGKIWAESFVEDANLTVAVSTLRKTLSVYENQPFIETIQRKGYRFVGDAREKVEIIEHPIIVERHAIEQVTIEKVVTADKFARKTYRASFLLLSLIGLIVSAGAFTVWQRADSRNADSSGSKSASEAFLKGDELLRKRQVCESTPYFREAVLHDAEFARAYANLAAALAMCSFTDEADEAIAKALALAPNSSDAQATDGFIKMFRHWDWDGAERALRRAVALNPNSAKAHHWLGVCLSIRGRVKEAAGEIKRALEIEPAEPLYHADLGQVYYFHEDFDLAASECRKALELDARHFFAIIYLRDIYLIQNREREAWEYFVKYEQIISAASPESLKQNEEIVRQKGFKGVFADRIKNNLDKWKQGKVSLKERTITSFHLAEDYARLGDRENALCWLEKAVEGERGTYPFTMAYVAVEPRFAFLRGEPRFQVVLQKMNLAEAR